MTETHLRAADYEVRDVPQALARELVERWHYARGGPNTGVFRHGLFRVGDDEALGVAWWLPPTRVAAESVNREHWRGVLSLTRLAVAPEVPTNGASFLLGQSIRRIRQDGRWTDLVTYADEGQGHTGAIYLATNWTPREKRRGDPVYLTPEGRQVARKSAGRSRTNAEMLALGYTNAGRTDKRKFTMSIRRAPKIVVDK